MNIDKYNEIFDRYQKYVTENSKYSPRVVKNYTNTTTYFPIISFVLSDNTETDYCTNDYIERYEQFYFTIDIYTKDKTQGANIKVASQLINDELTKLTIDFFSNIMRMKRTLNRPTPNLDTSVLRRTIQYQCMIGSARGNIVRR